MITRTSFTLTALAACTLGPGLAVPLEAQQWNEPIHGSAGEWGVQNLRPRGQPVVPIFDGWVAEEDGTASLCFGYFNLNYDEALEIPVGPNNYIEPEEYNGLQPTRFNPVPLDGGDKPRHYCVFSINVPQGGGEEIVWTLRRHYQDYTVPANSGALAYRVPDIYFSTDRAERGGSVVPIVRFIEPEGPEGIGKGLRGGQRVGPLAAQVGRPTHPHPGRPAARGRRVPGARRLRRGGEGVRGELAEVLGTAGRPRERGLQQQLHRGRPGGGNRDDPGHLRGARRLRAARTGAGRRLPEPVLLDQRLRGGQRQPVGVVFSAGAWMVGRHV